MMYTEKADIPYKIKNMIKAITINRIFNKIIVIFLSNLYLTINMLDKRKRATTEIVALIALFTFDYLNNFLNHAPIFAKKAAILLKKSMNLSLNVFFAGFSSSGL